LVERGAEFLLLDPRQYRQQFDLTWVQNAKALDGSLHYGGRELPLSAVRSLFVRHLQVPGNSASRRDAATAMSPAVAAHQTLDTFANTAPVLVANRPACWLSNGSKPYQQGLILQQGFSVPRTLVTMVPEEAQRFYDECQGRVIYKSISYRRSIVRRLGPSDCQRLEQVRTCPTQFQEYVPGVDIRVHTVGRQLFATEIDTPATDYRYSRHDGVERTMRPVELPAEVAERCLCLADALGLAISGIDLRRRPDGHYYCFEVNPTPAFTFYEQFTGQRIGAAVALLLCRGGMNPSL
jgi:glutathione synthase/RimK-type ligase-like ATP-grasp enzyme